MANSEGGWGISKSPQNKGFGFLVLICLEPFARSTTPLLEQNSWRVFKELT
jgi:hypothetical protein